MLFFHFRLGNTIICHSSKSGVKSATFVDSSTLAFAFGIQTYMDIKNGIKNPLCCNGNLFPNVDGRGALEIAYFLACFTDMCYYCFSNNSRTVRLISPYFRTKKNSPKFSANFLHLLQVSFGDGGT